jgi:hypothetical protein
MDLAQVELTLLPAPDERVNDSDPPSFPLGSTVISSSLTLNIRASLQRAMLLLGRRLLLLRWTFLFGQMRELTRRNFSDHSWTACVLTYRTRHSPNKSYAQGSNGSTLARATT